MLLGHLTKLKNKRMEIGVELGLLQRNRWVMTNSQRFGGGLLHFWPLSTMNWPEACTARIHVQGKCTCMETNTQIYTHTQTHTYMHARAHTRTHRQAHTHTYPHAQQRQAIRLHYKREQQKLKSRLAFWPSLASASAC